MSDLMRWGIVGTGAISATFVTDIAKSGNSLASAVFSRDPARAAAFAEEHGVPNASGGVLERFLAEAPVDIVYIATPQGTHHSIAAEALRAGKHVVVEKPIALTAAEVRDLVRVAGETGRFLMEGMWTKFSPAFIDVAALVSDGRIGEVRSVQASFGAAFPRETGSRWSAALGGSTLLDQGIYTVMLARAMLGEPTRVQASGSFFAPGVDETEWVTLEHANGGFSQLASSMVQWIDPSASINGTEGYIRLNAPFWATTSVEIHTGSATEILFNAERRDYDIEGNGFVPMIRSVSDAVRGGLLEHPVHSLAETLAGFEVLDTIRSVLPQ